MSMWSLYEHVCVFFNFVWLYIYIYTCVCGCVCVCVGVNADLWQVVFSALASVDQEAGEPLLPLITLLLTKGLQGAPEDTVYSHKSVQISAMKHKQSQTG